MKLALLALGLAAVVSMAAQTPRVDHVLDILTYQFTPEDPQNADDAPIPPGLVMVHGDGVPSDVRVIVTLLSLDRVSFETGDSFIYEVLIENAGNRPLIFPWSPDRNLFKVSERRTMPGFRQGILFLEVRDRTGSRRLGRLESQGLFGSEASIGSLQTLAPGERALIRTPGYWRATDWEMANVLGELNGQVRVSAVLDFVQDQVMVRSGNELEVVVRDRLRR